MGLRRGFATRDVLLVGALSGAMILTKLTTYGLVAVALAALALARLRGGAGPGALLAMVKTLGLALATMLAISGWWLARQVSVYGWHDLLAMQRHAEVVVGQPRWADLAVEPLPHFLSTLFNSFWAQFGWMSVLVDERIYRLFGLFTALAVLGLLGRLLQGRTARLARPLNSAAALTPAPTGATLALVLVVVAVVFAQVVYYNLWFVQPQGRYLFPALPALALLAAAGWYALGGLGPVGRGLAAAWTVAALLEAGGLSAGAPLPLRVVYGAALLVAVPVALARGKVADRLRLPLALAPVPAIAALNAVCLVRYVAPAFNP
jgi:hypothetical protein